eukprot:2221490-Prymnesium_polylepis.1
MASGHATSSSTLVVSVTLPLETLLPAEVPTQTCAYFYHHNESAFHASAECIPSEGDRPATIRALVTG